MYPRRSAVSHLTTALAAVVFTLVCGAPALQAKPPRTTALDRYVKTPDPAYKYTLVSSTPAAGYTVHMLEMTSQTWLTPNDVDRPTWTHWLTVIRPDTVSHQTALVFVGSGNNGGKPPERPNPLLTDIAVETKSVVAELRMVPNQPVTFTGETRPRKEDELIAYSWDKFLRTGDDRWPARLPMTKSVVRAMDTVTDFCAKKEGGASKIDRFVVAGASKRGWTTWTTAAVDSRVVAIVPMVIDLLNLEPSFMHHWRAYGFWAPAIKDYEDLQIMRWQGTPQYRALREIEDPYEYRDRLTLPKFIVNASGDQFFLPDSSQFYFDDLRGEKHLRYVPNTGHSLDKSDAIESVHAFYASVVKGRPRPEVRWTFERDGSIKIVTKQLPDDVRVWQATNPKARNFRHDVIGGAYTSTPLRPSGPNTWIATVAPPQEGWTAFFVEATFASGGKHPLKVTSGVRVVPDTLPHALPKRSSRSSQRR